jgi:hypothetical protein
MYQAFADDPRMDGFCEALFKAFQQLPLRFAPRPRKSRPISSGAGTFLQFDVDRVHEWVDQALTETSTTTTEEKKRTGGSAIARPIVPEEKVGSKLSERAFEADLSPADIKEINQLAYTKSGPLVGVETTWNLLSELLIVRAFIECPHKAIQLILTNENAGFIKRLPTGFLLLKTRNQIANKVRNVQVVIESRVD